MLKRPKKSTILEKKRKYITEEEGGGERKTKMGAGSNMLMAIIYSIDFLAVPLVSLVYPIYCSIKAIETKCVTDDQQWLAYWVLYSLLTLFELIFEGLLQWFPIWPYVKLIGICWLVLPYFNGAAFVYSDFMRPQLRKRCSQLGIFESS